MRHSFIDKLVCPDDRHFPLKLRVDEIKEVDNTPVRVCERYCSRRSVVFDEVTAGTGRPRQVKPDKDDCSTCRNIEITAGVLTCPVCATEYPVEDGIPMMQQHFINAEEDHKHQLREMAVRDEQASDYDELRLLKALSWLEVPVVMDLLDPSPTDSVVELGAGTGRITTLLASKVRNVVAVDFSLTSVKKSRNKCGAMNVDWVQADISRLPLRDEIADKVLSCQVFEHLPGVPKRNMAVDEAARVLVARGIFAISVYRDSWLWRMTGPKEGYHPGGIYYYRFGAAEFEQMLKRRFFIRTHVKNMAVYLRAASAVKKI